jgi:TonB family protein
MRRKNPMRNELRIVGLLAVVLMAVSASGQTAPAVPILQGAALPVYPPIAKAAHVTGKVTVRVTVKDGLVVQTDVLSKPSGQRFLETPTVENLKTWHFAADVAGTFTVTYTYEISGKESDDLTNPKVEMLPSLDVKITARPVKPTVMYEKQSSPSTR